MEEDNKRARLVVANSTEMLGKMMEHEDHAIGFFYYFDETALTSEVILKFSFYP